MIGRLQKSQGKEKHTHVSDSPANVMILKDTIVLGGPLESWAADFKRSNHRQQVCAKGKAVLDFNNVMGICHLYKNRAFF